jgi:hypothetical protein
MGRPQSIVRRLAAVLVQACLGDRTGAMRYPHHDDRPTTAPSSSTSGSYLRSRGRSFSWYYQRGLLPRWFLALAAKCLPLIPADSGALCIRAKTSTVNNNNSFRVGRRVRRRPDRRVLRWRVKVYGCCVRVYSQGWQCTNRQHRRHKCSCRHNQKYAPEHERPPSLWGSRLRHWLRSS